MIEQVEGLEDGGRWARPVRCKVGGGFTVSRLAGAARGADSPECLVTLVLNVRGSAWSGGALWGVAGVQGLIL